jgi:hypothetical protein
MRWRRDGRIQNEELGMTARPPNQGAETEAGTKGSGGEMRRIES